MVLHIIDTLREYSSLLMNKNFNILIIPSLNNAYDLRMAENFSNAFRNIGHIALAGKAGLSELEIARQCISNGHNVVLKINSVRKKEQTALKNIRFISWYQDIFPNTEKEIKEGLEEQDILYTMGDKHVLGLNEDIKCHNDVLMTGASSKLLEIKNKYQYIYDFSVCGFIPRNNVKNLRYLLIKLIKLILQFFLDNNIIIIKNEELNKKIRNTSDRNIDKIISDIVTKNYSPLEGNLDINLMCKLISNELIRLRIDIESKNIFEMIKYYSQTYPRRIDRELLVSQLMRLTNSIALFGPNWNTYPLFKKYHKGTIDVHPKLIDVYMRTKINIANNTHGIGLHSRTLEIMAVGGFFATHSSKHDLLSGGILDSFIPNEHFIYYEKNQIGDSLLKWLSDDIGRVRVGEKAREIVKSKHLWEHRALQVIRDLEK